MTKSTSGFGIQYDSLVDLVAFGVAPGIMVYLWALKDFKQFGWAAAFLFVVCGALRLARFNVYSGVTDRRYFVGLSTPAAAGMVCSTVLLLDGEELTRWHGMAISVGTYLVALLMVSTFRYYSFKDVDFARRRPVGVLLVVVLGLLIVATHPQWFLFLLFSVYLLSGPTRPGWARRLEGTPTTDKTPRDSQ
jgi:CDP-diacylglycerol--serine O-phosphatidyltransferase